MSLKKARRVTSDDVIAEFNRNSPALIDFISARSPSEWERVCRDLDSWSVGTVTAIDIDQVDNTIARVQVKVDFEDGGSWWLCARVGTKVLADIVRNKLGDSSVGVDGLIGFECWTHESVEKVSVVSIHTPPKPVGTMSTLPAPPEVPHTADTVARKLEDADRAAIQHPYFKKLMPS